MSVTTTATSVSYIYQEGEAYSLPYEYQNETDVKASYIDSDGNKVNLAYNVDYTVGGSTVTLIAALPDGVTITFSRQTEITQQTELPQQTITKAIETAIDKNTMCIQEIATGQEGLSTEVNAFTANVNQTVGNLEQNFKEFKEEVNQTVADAIAEVEAIKETAITEMNDIKDETQNIANNVNVFIPFVNNGTLSWTNEAGLPNPAPVNIKGEQGIPGNDGIDGIDGTDGKDGTAATITIGTVTTGEPGSSAAVVNSGTTTAAVFDITIPRGDKGADGAGAGDVIAAADNTFTATNTFEGVMKTTCDMQHYSTQTGGTLVLGYESDNFQTLIITDSPTEIRYNDTGSNMTGHKKTFIVTIIRKGSAAFKLSPINIVNGQTAYFRIMNGTLLPDIGTGELLKLGLEVDTEFNVIYVHILGGQVAEP